MAGTIPVSPLAQVFSDTASSYKLFWLRGLIECLKVQWRSEKVASTGPVRLRANDVAKEMLVAAWAPVCLFRLSLGQRDRLQTACSTLQSRLQLRPNASTGVIRSALSDSVFAELRLAWLLDFVPALFLSPWFLAELRPYKGGRERAKHAEILAHRLATTHDPPPYFLDRSSGELAIVMHPEWVSYLHQNLGLLDGFISHHLSFYLQARNPHSPGIVRKLSVPIRRSLADARLFWDTTLQRSIASGNDFLRREIYSGRAIEGKVTLDHFLPWSFVAHDQLWNLVPVLKDTNSAKGDSLPDDAYLPLMAKIHWHAMSLLSDRPTWLADYVTFLQRDVPEIAKLGEQVFVENFTNRLRPQIQLAKNHGFAAGWTW